MNKKIFKILRIVLFMLSIPAIISAFVFAKVSVKNNVCKGFDVRFENNEVSFLSKKDIADIIHNNHVWENKTKLGTINLNEIENELKSNHWVEKANTYISSDDKIHVVITQREPVIRIQMLDTLSDVLYLDSNSQIIPYNVNFIPHVHIATLDIDNHENKEKYFPSLVAMAQFLSKDSFWNVSISQIFIQNEKICLIPSFGMQKIIVGDTTSLHDKFQKLYALYEQGLRTIDWNLYDEIDLRFDRQVVCRNTSGLNLYIDPYDKSTLKKKTETQTTSKTSVLEKKEVTKNDNKNINKTEPAKTPTTNKTQKNNNTTNNNKTKSNHN